MSDASPPLEDPLRTASRAIAGRLESIEATLDEFTRRTAAQTAPAAGGPVSHGRNHEMPPSPTTTPGDVLSPTRILDIVWGPDNPAHVDAAWAAASQLGGRVAHGALRAGLISAVLETVATRDGEIVLTGEALVMPPAAAAQEKSPTAKAERPAPKGDG